MVLPQLLMLGGEMDGPLKFPPQGKVKTNQSPASHLPVIDVLCDAGCDGEGTGWAHAGSLRGLSRDTKLTKRGSQLN